MQNRLLKDKHTSINPCYAYEVHRMRLNTDEGYRKTRIELKKFAMEFRASMKWRGLPSSSITIPVVVHIVKGPNDPDILDERVRDQIDALNEDFSMSNREIGFIPKQQDHYFNSATPTGIQFALAKRTPQCEETDGIIRSETTKKCFNAITRKIKLPDGTYQDILDMSDVNTVKFPPDGQCAWPRDQYLNVWVCNFTVDNEPYSGTAEFPGVRAELDGVIINSMTFGRHKDVSSTSPPWKLEIGYNRGRSLTHEVGHWLNLYHIACDGDPANCKDSDLVRDTPNQRDQNHVCPYKEGSRDLTGNLFQYAHEWFDTQKCAKENFARGIFDCMAIPHPTCADPDTDNPIDKRGDMFINFMDYTQDMCKFMFTAGQAMRMNGTLNGPRHSLFASDGLVPVSVTGRYGLWIRHSPEDFGLEPDTYSEIFTDSEDIWVNKPYPFIVYDHDDPPRGEECTVFVRVRNSSCRNVENYMLKLYWAIGTTGLGWPSPWNGGRLGIKAARGGLIGTREIGPVGPHGFKVFSFKWVPPAPGSKALAMLEDGGFSFLARIVDPAKPNDGMTVPEGPNLLENIRNNNKIALKSVSIHRMLKGDLCNGTLFVGVEKKRSSLNKANATPGQTPHERLRLQFSVPEDGAHAGGSLPGSILDWADVYADLGKELFLDWEISGKPGEGVEEWKGYVVRITRSNAWVDLHVKPGSLHPIDLRFRRRPESPEGYYVFRFDAVQQERVPGGLAAVGGRRFIIKTFYRGQPIE